MQCQLCDLMPEDIGRYITYFLPCKDALNMEIAFKTKYNNKQHYIERIKYEPRRLSIGLYTVLCTYKKSRFCVNIIYDNKHQMSVLNHHSLTSKQALHKTIALFRLH